MSPVRRPWRLEENVGLPRYPNWWMCISTFTTKERAEAKLSILASFLPYNPERFRIRHFDETKTP